MQHKFYFGLVHLLIHPFCIPVSSCFGVTGSLSQLPSGEKRVTPWTGCQSITGQLSRSGFDRFLFLEHNKSSTHTCHQTVWKHRTSFSCSHYCESYRFTYFSFPKLCNLSYFFLSNHKTKDLFNLFHWVLSIYFLGTEWKSYTKKYRKFQRIFLHSNSVYYDSKIAIWIFRIKWGQFVM